MSEQRATSTGYYIAAAALIVLLIGAIGLIVAMAVRPSPSPPQATVVTTRDPIDCDVPSKNVTCFDSLVTNTGGSDGDVSCRLDTSGGADATFASGGTAQRFPLGAAESTHVVTTVTTSDSATAQTPRVICVAEPN